jgi:hypothetical protein
LSSACWKKFELRTSRKCVNVGSVGKYLIGVSKSSAEGMNAERSAQ